eukprot:m.117923 g.117923  ORF g.117923 m.117923 type:complete len:270 (+) comp9524_c0_seq4:138-947(+)
MASCAQLNPHEYAARHWPLLRDLVIDLLRAPPACADAGGAPLIFMDNFRVVFQVVASQLGDVLLGDLVRLLSELFFVEGAKARMCASGSAQEFLATVASFGQRYQQASEAILHIFGHLDRMCIAPNHDTSLAVILRGLYRRVFLSDDLCASLSIALATVAGDPQAESVVAVVASQLYGADRSLMRLHPPTFQRHIPAEAARCFGVLSSPGLEAAIAAEKNLVAQLRRGPVCSDRSPRKRIAEDDPAALKRANLLASAADDLELPLAEPE